MPGERIGFVALAPTMPDRAVLRDALCVGQLMTGWAFPNNSLLYAAEALDKYHPPTRSLERRRDYLQSMCLDLGWRASECEGTFYLLVETPARADWAVSQALAERGVLVFPAGLMGAPGYVRISLTGTDSMIEEAAARIRSVAPLLCRLGGDT